MTRITAILLAGVIALALPSNAAHAARTDLTLGAALEPPHLDPTAGAAAAIDEVVYANIFEGLTRIGPDGSVLPGLAESWIISGDGLTYTFNLRDGVRFHDGTEFDSADVVFSLDRARAEDSTNAQAGLFEPIESVTSAGPHRVVVQLKRPTGGFLFSMGWGDAVMVAPESAESNQTNPVGTGPFTFSNWARGDRIEIRRNPDYWGPPAKLEKATFRFIADPSAAFAALMAGDVDVFPNFPATENLPQFEADDRFQVVVGTTEGETILSINNTRPALSDIRVRRAISHAIDRQAIIDGAMFGYGTPIGSHFAPHDPAYLDLTGFYDYAPDHARDLLAEAGYAEGLTLSLKLPPPAYARRGGEIVASQLRAVGINVEVSNVEWAQWLKEVFRGDDFDLTIVSHTEPKDIGIYARDKYYFNYDSKSFRQIIDELKRTSDESRRTALLQDAQRTLTEDAVNGFLFQLAKAGVWRKGIEGLWSNAPVQANDLTAAYWTE